MELTEKQKKELVARAGTSLFQICDKHGVSFSHLPKNVQEAMISIYQVGAVWGLELVLGKRTVD